MFTGLIEETGKVKEVKKQGKGIRLIISAKKILEDVKVGDSININGVCQTVVEYSKDFFSVDTIEETIKKTTLGKLQKGIKVNLERSLQPSSRLGGHFVLGHVDTTGKIIEIKKLSSSYMLTISFPLQFSKNLIPVGSIAVDGISLTLAEVKENNFTVAIIPHTWQETNLREKKKGDEVNLEFDVLGKYVEKILGAKAKPSMSVEWLKEKGF